MRTYYPYSGTRGETTSRSTYCSPGIKTSSRRYLLLRSPLRLGRCLGPPRAIVSCCFHLVVFFYRCWYRQDPARWCLLVGSERTLSTCIPKRGRWLKNKNFYLSCSPLAAGKESIYLPSFGRFPPTQSTEIPRIPWWISPTTQQQCGIFFLVCWIWSIVRGQYIPKGSKKDNEWRSAPAKSSTAAVPELNALRLKGK